MIIAVGIDITEIERLRRTLERRKGAFEARVFTEQERDYAASQPDPVPSLAARFAVKEAVMKVLGTGWTKGVGFQDIETIREGTRAPHVVLHGVARTVAEERGISRLHISITHSAGIAAAVAVGEA